MKDCITKRNGLHCEKISQISPPFITWDYIYIYIYIYIQIILNAFRKTTYSNTLNFHLRLLYVLFFEISVKTEITVWNKRILIVS